MIIYPHAKINIGLHVLERRSDGFHNIETVFYPIEMCDILEIKPADKPQLFLYGQEVEGDPQDNLCMKAYRVLQADFDLPPVQLHLYKQIPVGAGMGGGSSDGAYTLRLINDYFSLGINDSKLEEYAARLGSDCPAMLYKRPTLGTEKGDRLSRVDIDLSPFYIFVCKPSISMSTAQAYANISPQKPKRPLQQLCALPISEWKECMVNDFESALFPQYPILKEYKEQLYHLGACYASLTGSGSALYGIFESKECYLQAHQYFNQLQTFVW